MEPETSTSHALAPGWGALSRTHAIRIALAGAAATAALLLAPPAATAAPPEKSRSRVILAYNEHDVWDVEEEEEEEEEPKSKASRRSGERQFSRAYDHHGDREWSESAAGFEEAYRLGCRRATSAYNAACAHARLKDADRAFEWLERAIDEGFDIEDYLESDRDLASLRSDPRFQKLAEEHGDRGKRQNLMRRLERLESAEADGGKLYQIGLELHYLGDYDAAIRAWTRSAELGEREGASTYNLACAHALKGDRARSLDALERAIDLGFGDADAIDGDEDLDSLHGDPRYEQILETANVLDLPDGGGWWHGGNARWERAAKRYEGYLEDHPQSGRGWFSLGFASLQIDRPERAVESFRKAYDLGHRKPTTAYNVACSYARNGDKDQAFAWLERARNEGFDHEWLLATDDDLDSLRDDPRFPDVRPFGGKWWQWMHRWSGHEED